MMTDSTQIKRWVLLAFLCLALYASFKLVQAYIDPIIMALLFSMLLYPLHLKILQLCRQRENVAAIVTCITFTILILLPIGFVISALLNEGQVLSAQIIAWTKGGGSDQLLQHSFLQGWIDQINSAVPFLNISLDGVITHVTNIAKELGSQTVNMGAQVIGQATNIIVKFTLMLFVLFFLLRDHDAVIDKIRVLVPLSRSQEDVLLSEVVQVTRSAILGSFATAVVQGILGGFIMYMAGFPGVFWGTMMAFASFIPVVGTTLIWGPAAIYLLLTGDWQWAIGMAAWGALVIGSVDNFLRPMLMQRGGGGESASTLFIFFSLLGGIQLFGMIGLIYGPVIFGITVVLVKMYEQEFKSFLEDQDRS